MIICKLCGQATCSSIAIALLWPLEWIENGTISLKISWALFAGFWTLSRPREPSLPIRMPLGAGDGPFRTPHSAFIHQEVVRPWDDIERYGLSLLLCSLPCCSLAVATRDPRQRAHLFPLGHQHRLVRLLRFKRLLDKPQRWM